MILTAAPPGFGAGADPAAAVSPVLDEASPDGRHIVFRDQTGTVRIWLMSGTEGGPLAIVIPLDGGAEARLAAAARLLPWLTRKTRGSAAARAMTPFKRHRLTLLLRILDGLSAGASRRSIAEILVYPSIAGLTRDQWKDSPERRHVRRLTNEAQALMRGGYRDLLRHQ